AYEWFEPPGSGQAGSGIELLYRLGALGSSRGNAPLTALGRRMARIPAHPRLARFLIEAARGDSREDAATLAALIQEGRLEGLDALAQLRGARGDQAVARARTQLLSGLESDAPSAKIELGQALLAGFPDRVGKLRKGSIVLSSGGSAAIEEQAVTRESEYFVVLDIQERQGQGHARSKLNVHSVCPIREEWLFDLDPPGLKEEERLVWDAERKRVVASSVLAYGDLVLSEDRKPPADLAGAATVVVREGLGVSAELEGRLTPADFIRSLLGLADPEAVEASLARISLLGKHYPELGAPALDPPSLAELLRRLVEGKLAIDELKQADLPAELLDLLPDGARGRIEQLLPSTVTLPGGRKPRVQYRLEKAPWIESRLQDFFGMKQGPSLLGGRLPLTLHLLAPNHRAVQITTDLAGFWQRAYKEVRRELSRNYPRHSWPEDPLTAEPPKPRR
ncbi:MAG TPA: ATP-dependent helicase C-terminal domain-containing protein, partial [Bdellovibrionota bacterium]|nr:ATP-dependent helicase C-terminal domain-containing protein [Bdellovibrionota bacterium]